MSGEGPLSWPTNRVTAQFPWGLEAVGSNHSLAGGISRMYRVPRHPRAKVVCVFRRQGEILVAESPDSVKGDTFWGPPGGGIEFGESAAEAAEREMLEELGVRIGEVHRLAVLENIFEYEGQPGHEILFVMSARFEEAALYERREIPGIEAGREFRLSWEEIARFESERRLVPDGLYDVLTNGEAGIRVSPRRR
jgi:8-oxo-dGTP pyrophosphatase MutT (NUDIX family)